jgi:hypothetical protein
MPKIDPVIGFQYKSSIIFAENWLKPPKVMILTCPRIHDGGGGAFAQRKSDKKKTKIKIIWIHSPALETFEKA